MATLLCGFLAALVSSCTTDRPAATKPLVAVSVAPQAYFVEQVAGDLVDVAVMIPAGANPHAYEPTFQQLRAVSGAALYVKVGHPHLAFEQAWMSKLLAERRDLPVVDGSAGVARLTDDPHVWLAPAHVRTMTTNIAAAIAALLPAEQARIDANRDRFLAAIDRLDGELRQQLTGLPQRRFYVFHPAWGYLAEAYGLEQVAIESEGKEPDAKRLADLIARARADGVRVVFNEPQFSASSAELVAREIGARVAVIDPQARDWADNLRRVAAQLHEALA